LSITDSYAAARKKLTKAQDYSDLSSSEETTGNKRAIGRPQLYADEFQMPVKRPYTKPQTPSPSTPNRIVNNTPRLVLALPEAASTVEQHHSPDDNELRLTGNI